MVMSTGMGRLCSATSQYVPKCRNSGSEIPEGEVGSTFDTGRGFNGVLGDTDREAARQSVKPVVPGWSEQT